MEAKKTLVLGATSNPSRYAYLAVQRLLRQEHEVIPVGIREGMIEGVAIQLGQPPLSDIDTVTLYLNPIRQKAYYEYILSLQPKRIIFNPGTENPELILMAKEKGIEAAVACTLVMLATATY